MSEEIALRYGKSKKGNYYIEDTLPTKHGYCIGPRHVGHAADNFSGMLGKAAIESGEKIGITCAAKGCTLTYAEHEIILAVKCKKDFNEKESYKTEAEAYLRDCKEKCEEDGYVGFAFVDCFS